MYKYSCLKFVPKAKPKPLKGLCKILFINFTKENPQNMMFNQTKNRINLKHIKHFQPIKIYK